MVKVCKIVLVAVLLWCLTSPLFAVSDFGGSPDVGDRFVDVRTFLFKIAGKNGWSLIISNDVHSPQKEVTGTTVDEALDGYFKGTSYNYRFADGCLYVAAERDLEIFFKQLPELEMALPKGKGKCCFSGNFPRIEMPFFCSMLRSISGVEIRAADDLQINLMMRIKNMSWQRIILAIVHLNRFRIHRTDFSMVISPEGV